MPNLTLLSFPTRRSSDLQPLQLRLAGAALDCERPLADRRQHLLGRQDLARDIRLAEPFEPAQCQHQRVNLASGELVEDRKSTRLNSSHTVISYAVFCLKK